MPSTSQIVPEHEYAHVMVVENDNSQRPRDTVNSTPTTYCNMMFVFSSPKGIDRELQTVVGSSAFVEKFGRGSFDVYGQPFLNAYAAAMTDAATLHCLRVTADDAAYAVGALVAHYKATPGSPDPGPTVEPTDKMVVNDHDVVASAETQGNVTTITVAGTDVTPGISAKNKSIMDYEGDESDIIDLSLDMPKIMSFDTGKTYQIKQTNPALSKYSGRDEYVKNEAGTWTKTKTYAGSELANDHNFAFLCDGKNPITFEIVEWGVAEKTLVKAVSNITNNTDLGVTIADEEAKANVSKSDTTYTVALTGDVVNKITNGSLYGSPTGKNVEIIIDFPGVENDETDWTVVQENANLEQFKSDPTVEQIKTKWTKIKTYKGSAIYDGYSALVGEGKGDVTLKLYKFNRDADQEESEFGAVTVTVNITNGYTFVESHEEEEEPVPGPIGETITVKVNSSITFAGAAAAAAKSAQLKAKAMMTRVNRLNTVLSEDDTHGQMDIYYTFESVAGVTDVTNLGNLVEVSPTPDEKGYSAVKIFEMACRGRGEWGNNIRFTLNSYARGDRMSAYKNYTLSIYEIANATLTKKEEFTVGFDPAAVSVDGNTLYADYLVGDPYENSQYISLKTNPNAFKELFAAYATVNPDTALTAETFDPLTGMEFGTSMTSIPYLTVDTTSAGTISMSGASGVALLNGSDGAFAADAVGREEALAEAYLKAYSGEIDRNVRSKKMYPTDIILDANFPVETKIAIHELVTERQDCMGIFDLGTDMNTFAGLMENLADVEPYLTSNREMVDGYRGKIQDPTTFKIVDVTSTYALAQMYPRHFQQNGDKHVPLAGSSYAIMTGFISGSAWPVYDDDLDAQVLDQLTSSKVNYLKVNSKKQVVRGAQTTRQDQDTNLSEGSNVFILLDIRRDAIQLCEQYEYNFAESSDLQRFNKAASILAEKYADQQVSSISAEFSMNDWESERGILHLYIDFVHKNIIKRSIVEITVNRGTAEA